MLLTDRLHRPLKALRLSVTDRCTFRCPACMPQEAFGEAPPWTARENLLGFEEIFRLAQAFVALGVEKIRLTGGEPLLRRDLPDLVALLRSLPGLQTLALTTNGADLHRLAAPLRSAGLDRLTVSLPSLDPVRFQRLTGSPVPLRQVLDGLEVARAAGFPPPHLNLMLRRGANEEDLLPLADFARRGGHRLRVIEFMDVGTANDWHPSQVVPAREVVARLQAHWPLVFQEQDGVSRTYRYEDGAGTLGTIASVTEPFCGTCDRARLTAQGMLHTCLFSAEGTDLRAPLRAGASPQELTGLIHAAWEVRQDRYSEERGGEQPPERRPEMFQLGG